jgi:2-dehydropantoate 2-reductase
MLCGRVDGQSDAQLAAFVAAAKEAGIDITQVNDIDRERWQKFVFLVGLSGATGALRSPLGPILADPDTRAFYRSLMAEVVALAQAKGIAIDESYIEDRMQFAEAAPKGMKASLLHDLERGNRIEVDWLAGKVVALGRELGVSTPANDAVYAVLKLHRMGQSPA